MPWLATPVILCVKHEDGRLRACRLTRTESRNGGRAISRSGSKARWPPRPSRRTEGSAITRPGALVRSARKVRMLICPSRARNAARCAVRTRPHPRRVALPPRQLLTGRRYPVAMPHSRHVRTIADNARQDAAGPQCRRRPSRAATSRRPQQGEASEKNRGEVLCYVGSASKRPAKQNPCTPPDRWT